MLLSFDVENYRSFKERQSFSLVANKYYNDYRGALIVDQLPGLKGYEYLPAAALFGPNASGKSNLFRAINQLKTLVMESAVLAPGTPLVYTPYQLDSSTRVEPTRFSITFTSDGIRYEYEIAYIASEVLFEELLSYPKGRKQVLFTRQTDSLSKSGIDVYTNPSLRMSRLAIDALRPNVLFLSLGAQLNNKVLLDLYAWFRDQLQVITAYSPDVNMLMDYSTSVLMGSYGEHKQSQIIDILGKADFGISKARVDTEQMPKELLSFIKATMNNELAQNILPEALSRNVVYLQHGSDEDAFELSIDDDSSGTRQFFSLLGPLIDVLDKGMVLIIDEFDTSLHPALSEVIVRLFQSRVTNPNGAQLVTATHNIHLLNNSTFRRDQVWFVEKDAGGASHLYSLDEYHPRKDESILTGYLKGRYGALPLFSDNFLVEAVSD